MRKLLVILALVGLTCVLGASQPPAAEAASYYISVMTFHPTGDSSHNAILTCGWHDIGDCVCPDAESKALDWVAQGGSTSVRVRFWAFGGPDSGTWVARMYSYKPTTGCYRIESDVKRISDYALFGKVVALHSTRPASTAYADIYSKSSGLSERRRSGEHGASRAGQLPIRGSPHPSVLSEWTQSGSVRQEWRHAD